jgi:putative endonuclease
MNRSTVLLASTAGASGLIVLRYGSKASSGQRGEPLVNRTYYVYILAGRYGVLYVGMTNNLVRRLNEHKAGRKGGFSHRYGTTRLVYFETTGDMHAALAREKEVKKWSRRKKLDLVRKVNPTFRDLGEEPSD